MVSTTALLTVAVAWLPANQADRELETRALAIHDRIITLDTHDDINPAHFTASCNYTMPLTTQVTLPRMEAGGLDVSFLIVYVGQSNPAQTPDAFQPGGYDRAYRAAVEKFEAIHRLTKEIAPARIGLALTPSDVVRIVEAGRKAAVIGIENGYPIGTDLDRVKEFHDRGGRYMSLAHNGHSQLADSHTGEETNAWSFGGLSPLGRQVIEAMNRLGMMVDVSHLSKGSTQQAIGLSKAPVIASHSAIRALADHSRNLDDETLTALKTSGGVVQVVAFGSYLRADPRERTAALADLRREFATGAEAAATGGRVAPPCPLETGDAAAPAPRPRLSGVNMAALSETRRAELERRLDDVDRRWPAAGRASVADLVDHIDYAVRLIGIDHVGISSDFDGGGGITGWNNAAESFNVTLELVRRGYTEEQIAKLWSGNLLRVWREAERVAASLPPIR